MNNETQHGYLVLADISGYTGYLAGVELDHAHEILTDLLDTIVRAFKPTLKIVKLEGDAVFGYVGENLVTRGETLLELVESAYAQFHSRIKSSHRHTTCQCKACQEMPRLDLKFFIHHGDYVVQNVSGILDLVGSDVNLAHRLMKNHVAETTGWKAYVLLTERCLEHLAVQPAGLHQQVESYEHLGDTQTFSYDLRSRYEGLMAAHRVVVGPEQALIQSEVNIPAPPPIVWEWLNDPFKRVKYTFQPGLKFVDVLKPGGRRGLGAKTHCMHGKDLAMEETVLDWRPFNYLTVEQRFWGLVMRMTCKLEPVEGEAGTRLLTYIDGTSPLPGPLRRPFFKLFMTLAFPMAKLFEKMRDKIIEHHTQQPGAVEAQVLTPA